MDTVAAQSASITPPLSGRTKWVACCFLLQLPWTAAVVASTLLWDLLLKPFGNNRLTKGARATIDRAARWAAPKMLRDERNADWLWVIFSTGIVAPGAFVWMAWRQHNLDHFDVLALFAYHVFIMGPYFRFFAYFATLAHQHGHQKSGFFKGRWHVLDPYVTYVMGFVYGHVPAQYPMGHVRIHHKYDNSLDDVTTTRHMNRAAPKALLDQLVRQLFSQMGVTVFLHHWRRGRTRDAWRMARGMAFFYGLMLSLTVWDWRVGLGYVQVPHLSIMLLIGAVNHVQHAFVDPTQPDNVYRNSVTLLEGHYNVFNEDFHAAHHLKPQANWQDLRTHYESNLDAYRDNGAIIFRDTQVYELLFWILLDRRDLMVTHLVDLTGEMTPADRLRLIEERLAYSPAA